MIYQINKTSIKLTKKIRSLGLKTLAKIVHERVLVT